MDFSKYLIATDLDGTFFDRTSHPAPANLEALERFRAGGGLFTVASGRVHTTILPCIENIREIVNVPAVVCNGNYLFDFHTGIPYFEQRLPQDIAKELLAFAAEEFPNVPLRGCIFEGTYYHHITEMEQLYIKACAPEVRFVLPPEQWRTDNWYKLVMHFGKELAPYGRARLQTRFGDRLCLTSSSAATVEIQSPGVSKAQGLEKLRNFSEQTKGRILIACGDYENDMEMLQAADIAVCPANASDAVKHICDYVLCDHNEGVIADIIARIERGELTAKKKRGITV